MASTSVKKIRALQRGIFVMRSLEKYKVLSLDELFCLTGIPKATLSRILRTLEDERLAAQRIADGKWLSRSGLRAVRHSTVKDSRLIQVAAPELATLCSKIIWPSDLSVRNGLHMRLVESSRPHAPLMFNKLSVDFEIDFLFSAPGRAYLAFCPIAERQKILSALSSRAEYGFLFERNRISTILEATHRDGYAHREPLWGGRSHLFRKDHDDGLDAIAVPIRTGETVHGCINIVWIRSILSVKDVVGLHLADLQQTATAIAAAFDPCP